jgi:LysR family hydrogen peroxide-inducible transcriptional activator
MISLRQIRYALAVEKQLHFRRAAEQCAISQSALSTALSEMEKQLGFNVFERDNKKVLVTPIGQKFLNKAREIQISLEDLMSLSQTQDALLSYPMSVGIIPTICTYLLPKVLPKLHSQYPDFEMQVVERRSAQLVEMVRSGAIDTAIIALPYPVEGLLTFEFWHEDFYWISHADDTSYEHDNIVTTKELANKKLMLLSDGHCLKDHALAACKKVERDASTISVTNLSTLVQLVVGKGGATLIPEMAVDQLVKGNDKIKMRKLEEPGPHRSLAFIVRPNYSNVNNIEALKQLFTSELARMT